VPLSQPGKQWDGIAVFLSASVLVQSLLRGGFDSVRARDGWSAQSRGLQRAELPDRNKCAESELMKQPEIYMREAG